MAEEAALVVDHEVALEHEGAVRLLARAFHLRFFGEGQDVVPDDVVLAVVLVEAAVRRVVDEVALHRDAGAALVGVEAPAAVAEAAHVVDVVMAHRGAFRRPERVDAAHVAQEALPEVVQVVPFDLVPLGAARGVAPAPAHRNRRVEEVGDLVVRDLVVRRGADPDADRAGEEFPAVADDAVVDAVRAHHVLVLGLVVQRAHLHAARAHVGDEAAFEDDVVGAAAEGEPITAEVGEFAAQEADGGGLLQRDDAVDPGDGRLVRFEGGQGRDALGVAELQVAELEVRHRPPGRALERQQLLQHRVGRPARGRRLAGAGQVGQLAGAAEEPLAGLVEQGRQVLDREAGQVVEGVVRLRRTAEDREGPLGGIHRLQTTAGVVPLMVEVHHRVPGFGVRNLREALQFLRIHAQLLPVGLARLGFALHALQERVALSMGAGADGPAVADPELLEGFRALRCAQFPAAGLARLERGQLASAGQHHVGARRRDVRDRVRRVPAIGGVERHGFGQAVGAGRKNDLNGLRQRSRQLTDGEARAFERGQRAVGPRGVRARELARPGVVAVRRHVQVEREEWEGQGEGREQGEVTGQHDVPLLDLRPPPDNALPYPQQPSRRGRRTGGAARSTMAMSGGGSGRRE